MTPTLAPASPPTVPPAVVAVVVAVVVAGSLLAGPGDRPCARCGAVLAETVTWPWTNRRRICVPCLRAVDEEGS